ncbi:MAG: DUF423 domain-containing protein [Rhodopirellula sp.]|nr:DUF423 domain-containing protein [Rhodopirellula sp.]
MNPRTCVLSGGILGAVGVAAGALGAHALEVRLSTEQLETYQVAVRYQVFHALALVLTGTLLAQHPLKAGRIAAWAFLIGILLFSGCLYGWLFSQWRPLVHVVPIGGIALIVGWIALAIAGWSLPAR